jgi:ribosomal protein L35
VQHPGLSEGQVFACAKECYVMPKLKNKKGVVKRFKVTKNKKVKYQQGGKSHLQTNKDSTRVRHLKRAHTVDNAKMKKYILRMLPYAGA